MQGRDTEKERKKKRNRKGKEKKKEKEREKYETHLSACSVQPVLVRILRKADCHLAPRARPAT